MSSVASWSRREPALEFTAVDPDAASELGIVCNVCLEPWDDPVEITPCGHVYCRACVASLTRCPTCVRDINGRKTPNRILVNQANAVKLKCVTCGRWTGTRAESRSHDCRRRDGAARPQVQTAGTQTEAAPAPVRRDEPRAAQPTNATTPAPRVTIDPVWRQYRMPQQEYDEAFAAFLLFENNGGMGAAGVTAMMDALGYPPLFVAELCSRLFFAGPRPIDFATALTGLKRLEAARYERAVARRQGQASA